MPEARCRLKELQSRAGLVPPQHPPREHALPLQTLRLSLQVLVAHVETSRGGAGGKGDDVEHERVEISEVRFRGGEAGRCSKCRQGSTVVMQTVCSQT